MEVLIQWISQIIVFLLLAAIIDLLIPATMMKKYVKFVVGLILILIFLKPLFYLFQIDIKQALESTFKQHSLENTNVNNIENSIEIQKSEIESAQNAYILEQMAVQLKDIAKKPLTDAYQTEIISIDFEFNAVGDYTFEDLEEVIIYLRETEEEEGTVNAVDDVVIDTEKTEPDDKNENTDKIITLLQEVWELKDKKLTIIWEGGAS